MAIVRLRYMGIVRPQLTNDEYHKVMYETREKKHYFIESAKYWKRVYEHGTVIPSFKASEMAVKVLSEFKQKYGKDFEIDETNELQFMQLCQYFTGSPAFERAQINGENAGFSLNKGIILMGPKGIGKTSMIKMFRTNQHACFTVKSTLTIAQAYADQKDAEKGSVLDYYGTIIKCAVNANIFRQTQLGICFDDLGRENERNKYGNVLKVIAYLFAVRYENEVPFKYTHITTNITTQQIEEIYGTRTKDIFRESFNLITFDPKLTSRR